MAIGQDRLEVALRGLGADPAWPQERILSHLRLYQHQSDVGISAPVLKLLRQNGYPTLPASRVPDELDY